MNIFYPIQLFSDLITYHAFGLSHDELLGEVINYFIFDVIKIFILLGIIIFVVSLIRSYLPQEKIRNILASQSKVVGHILASLIGIIMPFCSCSAVPLFLGFVETGVPLGITFSFLVAAPMINEVALAMLFGSFGLKVALIYIGSGLLIAVVSGMVIGHLKVEYLLEDLGHGKRYKKDESMIKMTWEDRVSYAWNYSIKIIKKVGVYIVIGVGLGALIHGYAPADFLAQYAGADKWYAVPLATLVGIPLYSNAAGVMPIVNVLFEKGVALGTVLAFMMAVTALSLPEFLILRKLMKPKLIMIFAGVVGVGIIFTGYIFNAIKL